MIHNVRVHSGAIMALKYDTQSQVLSVRFNSDTVYEYVCVPMQAFRAMIKTSVGRYYRQVIQKRYGPGVKKKE